ncbi:peptidase M20 [Streptomyces nanshensis]|nr:peptidase M20 [Streptomyces nanshensis]
MNEAKKRVQADVGSVRDELIALSESLHRNPETAWKEFESARKVAEVLRRNGFEVTENFAGLPTAFHARLGSGTKRIGYMAEYDALPGIGHACGHNLISAMSVGAAIALAQRAGELGITVEVFGTPAEEGGGGKIEMLDRGAFEGLDFAMMAHPAPVDVARAVPFAVSHSAIRYTGRAAHAAAYPTHGRNAADAFTIAQVAIGMLRQQLPPSVRVHGIVTSGGEAPNAIPQTTAGRWYVRAKDMAELAETEEKVRRCFEAGALATGCDLEIEPESQPYSDFRTHEAALKSYEQNAVELGRELVTEGAETEMCRASTDMGNVSQVVPAIHPYIGLGCFPVLNHQKEFADHCTGEAAGRTVTDGATALAWTAVDLAQGRMT